jgi:integrase
VGRVKLAPAQVNKTLKRLSQILEVAEEYGHVPRNPARGKRRRVKEPRRKPTWVEPEQVPSLIAAGSSAMRRVIATLIGTGMRVSEAVQLHWCSVSLATSTVTVGRSKTDAGSYRQIDLPDGLVEELTVEDAKRRSARNLEGPEPGRRRAAVPQRPRRPCPTPVSGERRPEAQDRDQAGEH